MSYPWDRRKIFELKEEHIKLLKAAYVGWNDCEFGAPEIDPKRPYGNSSVYPDIGKILDIPHDPCRDPNADGRYAWTGTQCEEMRQLHDETQIALQIFLKNAKIEPGEYEAFGYKVDWKPVHGLSETKKTEAK